MKHKKIISPKFLKTNRYLIIGVLLVIVGVFAWYLSRQPAQIAEIAGGPRVQECTGELESINFTQECATPGTFKGVSYTCQGQITNSKTSSGSDCYSYKEVLIDARMYCQQACQKPSPTPTTMPSSSPTLSPKPSPSCIPNPCPAGALCKMLAPLPDGQIYCPPTSPSPTSTPSKMPISCELKVYRIPAGAGPNDPYELLKPNGGSVNTGDQLVYDVSFTNPNSYKVSGSLKLTTTNLNGSAEPITPIAYNRESCQYNSASKSLDYNLPHQVLAPNNTVGLSNAQLKVRVEPSDRASTGINYTYTFNGITGSCLPYTITFIKTNNAATPTPTPTPTSVTTSKPSFSSCYSACRARKLPLMQCV